MMTYDNMRDPKEVAEGTHQLVDGLVKVVSNVYRPVDELILDSLKEIQTKIEEVATVSKLTVRIHRCDVDAIAKAVARRMQFGHDFTQGILLPVPGQVLSTEAAELQGGVEREYQVSPDLSVQESLDDGLATSKGGSSHASAKKPGLFSTRKCQQGKRHGWIDEDLETNIKTAGGEVDLSLDPWRVAQKEAAKAREMRAGERSVDVPAAIRKPQSVQKRHQSKIPQPSSRAQSTTPKRNLVHAQLSMTAAVMQQNRPTATTTATPALKHRPVRGSGQQSVNYASASFPSTSQGAQRHTVQGLSAKQASKRKTDDEYLSARRSKVWRASNDLSVKSPSDSDDETDNDRVNASRQRSASHV